MILFNNQKQRFYPVTSHSRVHPVENGVRTGHRFSSSSFRVFLLCHPSRSPRISEYWFMAALPDACARENAREFFRKILKKFSRNFLEKIL